MSGPGVYQIAVERTGCLLASRAVWAATLRQRLIGFLGRRDLSEGEGMIFPDCRSVHTVGMWCAIDLVFIDRDWRVVALQLSVLPWRLVGPIRAAWGTVELPAGTGERLGLQAGDRLRLREIGGSP